MYFLPSQFDTNMVKPLSFKGDKKAKKRKREAAADETATGEVALANADAEPENDDSWVPSEAITDIVGPVMFVLPSSPPTSLACDPNGQVFADPIENIVDGNPSSAEPHDVRQVWVANRIVGTETFRFKGRYGK